jgi:hypothetical protein
LGIWLVPIEPSARLVPVIIVAGAISVVIAVATTARRGPSDSDGSPGPRQVAVRVTAWAFLWAALLLSVAAIAVHYVVST